MQIPILNGIYADENSDFRTSYPLNLIPVPKSTGISSGYLRPAEGIKHLASTPGIDRGAIRWDDICYRVCGQRLIRVNEDGTVTDLGFVGGSEQVSMDYSFDYLAIASGGNLYYYDKNTIQQVTDPDLGTALTVQYIDGYFMTTDGEFIVVSDLDDPFSFNPLKYGSSEVDPDPILGTTKVHDEAHALNRYTIEVFDNVGGAGFPFQRVDGGHISRGVLGAHCNAVYMEMVAFLGSGRNEPPSVWIAAGGTSQKIATREVDVLINAYSEKVLAATVMESRVQDGHTWLYIHLPDFCLVYDATGSGEAGTPVWFKLASGTSPQKYRAVNHVWCYNKWIVGDTKSPSVGTMTDKIGTHWGDLTIWEFGTIVLYNDSMGGIIHELEIVCLPGRMALGVEPTVATQYSTDGEVWSQLKYIKVGTEGQRNKRLVWFGQGRMSDRRMQKFCGTSESRLSIARLEARVEPLSF